MRLPAFTTSFFALGISAAAAQSAIYNAPSTASHVLPSGFPLASATPKITKSGIPSPAPIFETINWTGPYAGVTLGAGWMNNRLEAPELANFDGVGMYGFAGGVTAGFDYQFSPQIVAGFVADGTLNSTSASGSISGLGSADYREEGSWALRGRLGTLTSDDTMVYVTAGVSEIFTNLNFPGFAGAGGHTSYMGPVFGAGIETQLGGNVYLRAEYLHGLYDKKWFDYGLFTATPETGIARIGLIFKPAEWAAGSPSPAGVSVGEGWTGAYAGVHGGWGRSSTLVSSTNAFHADGIGGSGPVGGVLVGYQQQLGPGVAGVEADASASDLASSLNVTALGVSASARLSYDWDYSLRAKLGRTFGNSMLFVTGGWSQTGGRLSTAGLGGISASHVFSGGQFGGGVETMITSHIGARIEYLHAFYGKYGNINGSLIDARPTTGKTRAALIYKF